MLAPTCRRNGRGRRVCDSAGHRWEIVWQLEGAAPRPDVSTRSATADCRDDHLGHQRPFRSVFANAGAAQWGYRLGILAAWATAVRSSSPPMSRSSFSGPWRKRLLTSRGRGEHGLDRGFDSDRRLIEFRTDPDKNVLTEIEPEPTHADELRTTPHANTSAVGRTRRQRPSAFDELQSLAIQRSASATEVALARRRSASVSTGAGVLLVPLT
jgi:hypothetical protein